MGTSMTRRSFLRFSGTALAGASALGLTGCAGGGREGAGGAGAQIRLTWWGSNDRHERTQQALKVFGEKHPDITVAGEPSSFPGYFEKMSTQTAGGNAPDVMQMLDQFLPEYAKRGVLLDLQQHAGKELDLSAWPQESLETGTFGGKLNGLSFGDNSPTVYYDTTVLEQARIELPPPDWTWEDFERISNDIAKRTPDGYYGCEDSSGLDYGLEIWVRQRGKELYTPEGKLGFAKSDLADWYEFWDGLRASGAAAPAELQSLSQGGHSDTPLVKGKAATLINYANLLTSLSALTKHELDIVPLPNAGDQVRSGWYVRPVNWISAFGESGAPEATATLIDFLVNDVEAGRILKTDRGVPPSPEVREAIKPALNDLENRVVEVVEVVGQDATPLTIPRPQGAGEVYDLMERIADDISFGKVSIPEAVDKIFAEAERVLK